MQSHQAIYSFTEKLLKWSTSVSASKFKHVTLIIVT